MLVEDNEGDIVLTLEAFKDVRIHNPISVVRDGEQAIQYLNREGEFANEQLPDIILLDINLPKIDGKEVLQFIKTHPVYRAIPVVILTTSSSDKDISDAYAGYANCYITKPVDFSNFMQVVQAIEGFWISIVKLPKHS